MVDPVQVNANGGREDQLENGRFDDIGEQGVFYKHKNKLFQSQIWYLCSKCPIFKKFKNELKLFYSKFSKVAELIFADCWIEKPNKKFFQKK